MNHCRPILSLVGFAALISRADAQVLVDLSASGWSGSGNWANNGTLGGSFTPDGNPTKVTANGVTGVFFDGVDAFRGMATPAGVTGTGDRTTEVWVYQGAVNAEETLVAWGKRGGGDGTNNSVNWGTNTTFGAFGGWGGGPDQGFGAGQPAKGSWHHIAMTVDGTNKTVFVDGVQVSQEANSGPALNTHAGLDFLLGAQHAAGSAPGVPVIDGGNKLSGVIGSVKVHDGALTASDILTSYNASKSAFQLASVPTSALSAAPTHRWSFNEGSGTSFADSGTAANAGTAAQLKGAGAAVTATGVDLPGGASATQAYIDLPNLVASGKDIGAGYGSVTYETWVTQSAITNWGRVLDFGNNSAGEVTGPGGTFNGTDYILLSGSVGTSDSMRIEKLGTGAGTRDAAVSTLLGSEQHIVMTYDGTDGMWKWYQNGKLMEGFAGNAPSSINDVNNWLGRSNWAGDANTDATYNEFRIYDYALTEAQVQQNLLDGPNALTVVPEPSAAVLGVAGLGLLAGRRRRSR